MLGRGPPARFESPNIVFPLGRELAAASAPIRVLVAVTCRVLELSTQGYYKRLKVPVSRPRRRPEQGKAVGHLRAPHREGALGVRADASASRIWADLQAQPSPRPTPRAPSPT